MYNLSSETKLEKFLEHQFCGFLNYGLRNLWLFTQEGCPRSWQRAGQVDTFLSRNDIKFVSVEIPKNGVAFIHWDRRGRFFVDLVNDLMKKCDQESLRRLAEKKDRNVKLEILLRMLKTFHQRTFHIYHFLDISYRRRIHRAMKTLGHLKLVEKVEPQRRGYQLTRIGRQIAVVLEWYLWDWLPTEKAWFLTIWQGINRIASETDDL